MTDTATTTLLAHAKVNLYLAVGARRADGYHDVATIVQAVGLADEVRVTLNTDGDEVRCSGADIPADENLAWHAVVAFREAYGEGAPVAIDLAKHIPAGAGLGGGSADAAAVLLALDRDRWREAGYMDPGLLRLAAGIGMDVPFFLGPGTQMLGGRGDELMDVLPTPDLSVVLVNPGVSVPTGAAYAQFDRLLAPAPESPAAILQAVRDGDPARIAACLFDNMTEASAGLVPEIRDALRFLEGSPGVLGASMAGSGSSVFGICADDACAAQVAGEARSRGWWAEATRTVSAGVTMSGASS